MPAKYRFLQVLILLAPCLVFCGCQRCPVVAKTPAVPPPPPVTGSGDAGASGVWRGGTSGPPSQAVTLNLDQRLTEYRDIVFEPGDQIVINAGGCVDTGSHGPRRFVDPNGPESIRLYHGLIWIPGATPGLVHLQGWQNRPLTIPPNFPKDSRLFLRLGYEFDPDDVGSSHHNIPADHGDSDSSQCKSLKAAFVQVYVSHPAAAPNPSSPAPLDLVWNHWDPNLLPYYPFWTYKINNPKPHDCPNAQCLCSGFTVLNDQISFGPNPCTTQSPSIDHPASGSTNSLICGTGGLFGPKNGLRGHVNWFPATYTGILNYDQRGPDGDVNIHFDPNLPQPPDPSDRPDSILTTENIKSVGAAIELEFNDVETIYQFETDWWLDFTSAVDAEKGVESDMIDGATAVVTGLVGVDNEHGSHSELHPVYALAIKSKKSTNQEEVWPFFVRNRGDEGECSQDIHFLDVPDNKYTFRLPTWGGVGDTLPEATFVHGSGDQQKKDPLQVAGSPTEGVLATFQLPKPPSPGSMIEGEIHLKWATPLPSGSAKFRALPPSSAAPAKRIKPKKETGEDSLGKIVAALSPQEKKDYREQLRNLFAKPPSAGETPQQQRENIDCLRIRLLCDKVGNNIKGFPNLCASVQGRCPAAPPK